MFLKKKKLKQAMQNRKDNSFTIVENQSRLEFMQSLLFKQMSSSEDSQNVSTAIAEMDSVL